jgi:hypothetical protein
MWFGSTPSLDRVGDFMAPHRHLAVDVTVTSARTNTNVPRIGGYVLVSHSRVVLHWELSIANSRRTSVLPRCMADLRTSAFGSVGPLQLSLLCGGWW